MNITEFMSFDLEWFTTLPGLLITGGVVVLLIALIIFIVSNKKADKKNVDGVTPVDTNISQTNDVTSVPIITPVDNQLPVNNMSVGNNAPIDFNTPINNGYSANTVNNMGSVEVPVVSEPANDNVFRASSSNNVIIPTTNETQPVEPSFNSVTPVNNNVIDFTNTVTPNVPVVPQTEGVIAEPVVAPIQEVNTVPVVNEPVAEEKPMIYGGVNPINTITNNTPASRPVIYGGANPLENTTTLPRITSSEAYSASSNNATNVPVNKAVQNPAVQEAPTVDVVMPTQEVNPVKEPAVTPVMPTTGAEMFGANISAFDDTSSNTSSEIETLEF